MGNTVQPGAKVDEETYERFKQFVKDNHGRIRGSLADELEIAMRERMNTANGRDPLARIEDDLATIKATLAEADSDGGTVAPPPTDTENTHTRENAKPPANQPRAVKYDYLIGQLFDGKAVGSPSGGELAPRTIRKTITDNYDVDDAIIDEWVDGIQHRIGSDYDAEPHPEHGKTLVWGERLEELTDDEDDDDE
jgi:catechol 2,3-dioxygenase-like lactoylglutathione lyase family enzyme